MLSARGSAAGSAASTALVPHFARTRPSAPPAIPSSTLSVNSWRITRNWLAPLAARMANSRARPPQRASSRLGTLAQRVSKHKPHRAQKDEQRRLDVADNILFQRVQSDAGALVGIGIRRGKVAGDGIHIRASLLESDAALQFSHALRAHADLAVAESGVGPLPDRYVNIHHGGIEHRRAAGDHANHGVRGVIQREALANHFR